MLAPVPNWPTLPVASSAIQKARTLAVPTVCWVAPMHQMSVAGFSVANILATEKPATLIWCMGATQHTVGTANVRAFCIALLATGNVGQFGTGANIFRGHTNVQGATDLGLDIVTLPLYYGLAEGAWKHWCRVWEVDYDWMRSRFDSKVIMEAPGKPSTRRFDAPLPSKDQVAKQDNLNTLVV